MLPECRRVIHPLQVHQLVDEHVIADPVRHLQEPPVQADVPARRTRSPTRALIPDTDARHRDTVTRRQLQQPCRELEPRPRAQLARFVVGRHPPGRTGPRDNDTRQLLVDPRPFAFRKGFRLALGTPARNRHPDRSVGSHADQVPPRLRMPNKKWLDHSPASARAERSHRPPSTTRTTPVTKDAASEHKNRAAVAMSSIVASRPSGQSSSILFSDSGVTRRRTPSVPSTGPGATAFTRTPAGPHSTASARVSASTPALAADACDWPTVPRSWSVALIFRMTPFRDSRCGKAARETLNVPLRSMSTTVPNPLGERFSARQKKLPAAPLTRMSRRPNVCDRLRDYRFHSSRIADVASESERAHAGLPNLGRCRLEMLLLAA